MNIRIYILVLAVILLIPAGSEAIKLTLPPSQDAYISNEDPNTNFDTDSLLVRYRSNPPNPYVDIKETLIQFHLGLIPPDATINAAYLYLYENAVNGTQVGIYENTGAWIEHLVTWFNAPPPGDFVEWLEGPAPTGWYIIPMTSLVRDWHAGITSNYGIRIKYGLFQGWTRDFDSVEGTNPPYLVVIFDSDSKIINPDMDAFVSQANPGSNYGSNDTLKVSGLSGSAYRTYLDFDLAEIPAGATIDFARLRLNHFVGSGPTIGDRAGAYRVTAPWVEGSITWPPPAFASPAECFKGNYGESDYFGWMDWDITVLVREWMNGTYSNYGVVIKHPDEAVSSGTGFFRSREWSVEDEKPQLEIFYSALPPNTFVPWQTLTGVERGDGEWGDIDNDGDLDLIYCGDDGTGPVTLIYKNTGGVLSEVASGIQGVKSQGSNCLDLGDYDNDGDLDLAIAGRDTGSTRITRIYANNGLGNFTWDAAQTLSGVSNASLAWGDYDNDGDLDLYLQGDTGIELVAILYENDPLGTLEPAESCTPMTGLQKGSADWGDFNNDGDLDLLVTGATDSGRLTNFYMNTDGSLDSTGNRGLPDVCFSDAAFGDYDGDGDLDLAFTGQDTSLSELSGIYNYHTELDSFVGVMSLFPGMMRGSCTWGDFDNDGWLDAAFSGYEEPTGVATEIYTCMRQDIFVLFTALTGAQGGSVSWADVDDDGDLDLFVMGLGPAVPVATVFQNNGGVANTAPSTPSSFVSVQYKPSFPALPHKLLLRWSGASDSETSDRGLYYNVRVGTTPLGNDILSGTYGTPLMGNVGQTTELELSEQNLGAYYWSVKAIDSGFETSDWSTVQWAHGAYILKDKELSPADDAFVNINNPDSLHGVINFDILNVGQFNATVDLSRTYFKFYLGEGFQDSIAIVSAELYACCYSVSKLGPYYVGAWSEGDDSWSENLINWLNAPIEFHPYPWDCVRIDECPDPGRWYVWDVTKGVTATVDDNITLVLRNCSPWEGAPGYSVDFYSDENTTQPSLRPYLKITYAEVGEGSGVDDGEGPKPQRFSLAQNYPNPFNPYTRFHYTIPEGPLPNHVLLRIYDVAGRLVRTLINEPQPPGIYTVTWDGMNQDGVPAASGIYFYRLHWNGENRVKKMVLLR